MARRAALAKALELKNYEYNAQGVELNQRYASNAVLDDDLAAEEVWKRDPQLYLQATTRPGAKLPHAWVIDAGGKRVSTLDLVGKGRFTLITGIAGQAWTQAARSLNLPYLDTLVIGEKDAQDVYCNWQAIREIEEAGALLVRPDGMVAWRYMSDPASIDNASSLLKIALSSVLATHLEVA